MGRDLRIKGDEIHYHVIMRCNNKERFFGRSEDCQRTLEFFKKYKDRHCFELYNYVIMPTHIHIMMMTNHGIHIDTALHDLCLAIARDYNKRNKRSGHFWRNRYRCKVIADDRYALACLRYIHRNPVAAGLCSCIEDWPWSTYSHYATGSEHPLITTHPSYLLLGNTPGQRQSCYRELAALETIPAEAEKSLLEGRCSEGKRRYREASRSVYSSLTEFLMKYRYV